MVRSDATSPGQQQAVPRVRDPFFDNAKFLLIVLVVLGHNWLYGVDDFRTVKAAYTVVYIFHIPAFALICGYLSRGFEGRPEQWRKLLTTVLLPYLIFQLAYAALNALTSDKPFHVDFSAPIYVCWFLLALFAWRVSTPIWKSLPHPVIVSIVVSVIAGLCVGTSAYALSRALQLLPWFVIGLRLQRSHFDLLDRRWVRVSSAAVLVVALGAAYLAAPSIDIRWFDRQLDAKDLGVSIPGFLATFIGLELLTAVLVAAVLALVPRRRSWITGLGAFTMYSFLLHGLVVRATQRAGLHGFLLDQGLLGVAVLTAGAVALAALLATPVVRFLTGWAVEPSWLALRAPAVQHAGQGKS